MDAESVAKKAVNKAIGSGWKVGKEHTDPGDRAPYDYTYTLSSPWGFKRIKVAKEHILFETLFSGSELDGDFVIEFMKLQVLHNANKTKEYAMEVKEIEDWIKRRFL